MIQELYYIIFIVIIVTSFTLILLKYITVNRIYIIVKKFNIFNHNIRNTSMNSIYVDTGTENCKEVCENEIIIVSF